MRFLVLCFLLSSSALALTQSELIQQVSETKDEALNQVEQMSKDNKLIDKEVLNSAIKKGFEGVLKKIKVLDNEDLVAVDGITKTYNKQKQHHRDSMKTLLPKLMKGETPFTEKQIKEALAFDQKTLNTYKYTESLFSMIPSTAHFDKKKITEQLLVSQYKNLSKADRQAILLHTQRPRAIAYFKAFTDLPLIFAKELLKMQPKNK